MSLEGTTFRTTLYLLPRMALDIYVGMAFDVFFVVGMAFDGGDCKLIAAWAEEKLGR